MVSIKHRAGQMFVGQTVFWAKVVEQVEEINIIGKKAH